MKVTEPEWPLFTYEYQYQDAQWSFEIPAKNMADAEARMKAIRTTGVLSGEMMVNIPVPGRRLGAVMQAIRNLFSEL